MEKESQPLTLQQRCTEGGETASEATTTAVAGPPPPDPSSSDAPTGGVIAAFSEEKFAAPKKKRGGGRKRRPKDMPKRPLSAYNIFFKEERAKIMAQADAVAHKDEDSRGGERPPKKRRRKGQYVPHGKVEFESLAKTIGARWKELLPERLRHYKALAEGEMAKYKDLIKLYHAAKSERWKEQEEGRSKHDIIQEDAEEKRGLSEYGRKSAQVKVDLGRIREQMVRQEEDEHRRGDEAMQVQEMLHLQCNDDEDGSLPQDNSMKPHLEERMGHDMDQGQERPMQQQKAVPTQEVLSPAQEENLPLSPKNHSSARSSTDLHVKPDARGVLSATFGTATSFRTSQQTSETAHKSLLLTTAEFPSPLPSGCVANPPMLPSPPMLPRWEMPGKPSAAAFNVSTPQEADAIFALPALASSPPWSLASHAGSAFPDHNTAAGTAGGGTFHPGMFRERNPTVSTLLLQQAQLQQVQLRHEQQRVMELETLCALARQRQERWQLRHEQQRVMELEALCALARQRQERWQRRWRQEMVLDEALLGASSRKRRHQAVGAVM